MFGSKGQGTTEYLVIVAVVIVIGLVVVGLLVGLLSQGGDVASNASEIALKSSTLSVVDTVVDGDGNYLLRIYNLSPGEVTVSNVKVGDVDANFSGDLSFNGSGGFVVPSSDVCTSGVPVARDVVVTYFTKSGLRKVQSFSTEAFFDCSDFGVDLLVDRCPSSSGTDTSDANATSDVVLLGYDFYGSGGTLVDGTLTIGSRLHSGQTTSYDSGALDDAEQDGTAKSYTDNGDGTVTDDHTGLVWQKDHYGVYCTTVLWEEALSYCSTLADGVAGLTDGSSAGDWRVPSNVELITLVDYSYPSSSFLNDVFSQAGANALCYGYWSSTTDPRSTLSAYNLSFYGLLSSQSKTLPETFSVRCVR